MKKSLLALAALGAFAGAAHAQSSVTLYGVIDAGVDYVSSAQQNATTGGKQIALTSGVMQGSRWGVRGTENLGGGLKAIFTLENGFNLANGKLAQGGSEFGRQAFVGLSGDFGTVTVGRQYDSVVDFVSGFSAGNQWGSYAAHPGDFDNFNNSARINNSIKYTSPNNAGFTYSALYSLGGFAGEFQKNRVWSVGAGYANGPLAFGAAYLNAKNPNLSFYGNTDADANTPLARGGFGNSIIGNFSTASTLEVIGVGGSYTFGPATLGLTYSNVKFKDLNDDRSNGKGAGFSGSPKFNNGEVNLAYQLTPALKVGGAYSYTQGNSVINEVTNETFSKAKYHQVNLGADYSLSKRTDVYVVGAYQKASGNKSDVTGQGGVNAQIANLEESRNDRQAAVRVGLRHKF
ncbi:porin [Mycoavidus sp. B2-EB]|uniref:porin n=1 Tax=Mycoavidus sp. B2-EB TaxID=2651972 RepID=UPI0016240F7D|nr:porin [Mycoavidus sp. B2-EB]BBO60294.1 porin [Mycoavidus sp. B2-EB]